MIQVADCALLVIVLTLSCAAVARCTPTTSAEVDSEIAHLQQLIRVHPTDAVLLYNLAADYAAKCDA